MPGDPNRRRPGTATDPGREANHIESTGHVERELPDSISDAHGTKGTRQGKAESHEAYRRGTGEPVKSGGVEEQAQKAGEALRSEEGSGLGKAEDTRRTDKPR
jgi:hypothetical protein